MILLSEVFNGRDSFRPGFGQPKCQVFFDLIEISQIFFGNDFAHFYFLLWIKKQQDFFTIIIYSIKRKDASFFLF